MLCFFVCDLHEKADRYKKLYSKIEEEKPDAVFFGGDLFPSGIQSLASEFQVNKIKNRTSILKSQSHTGRIVPEIDKEHISEFI